MHLLSAASRYGRVRRESWSKSRELSLHGSFGIVLKYEDLIARDWVGVGEKKEEKENPILCLNKKSLSDKIDYAMSLYSVNEMGSSFNEKVLKKYLLQQIFS